MKFSNRENRLPGGVFCSNRWLVKCLVTGILLMGLFSCSGPKNIAYFRDVPDTVLNTTIAQAIYKTPAIQIDDILQVTIQTLDPAATALLNQQSGIASAQQAGVATAASGYLVDKDGNIALPLIGKVNVKSKSTDEVRDDIQVKAAALYKDPVVNVRFANFKITVLGEVTRPSSYIMPNEKVTILDALGAAGDLTIYGKRENVLLIREAAGKKEFVRFNLNNSNLFASPYYYLHQGDVVYVEPNKSKIAATDMQQVKRISIMASVLSLLIVIGSRINF
ncbi:polysaccharide export outer membrane protein [Chitinophaga niastensis]|uniref:Polysaccharide export outer membrane protein n=1 Tax=Chitinophaga niastensis TaxID=536980 RepID=A0A2P8HF82_CHINA|nr:polysaccharide biosynthesis/export family protein [Chitinophaga niastensis]PSL44892.1 polysaccharide export outer membrane protein [Chitinophaga niastensis]